LQWCLTRSQSLQSEHGLGAAVGQPNLSEKSFLVAVAAAVGRPLQAGIEDASAKHQDLSTLPAHHIQAIASADTLVGLTRMHTTGCSEETRLVLHAPGST